MCTDPPSISAPPFTGFPRKISSQNERTSLVLGQLCLSEVLLIPCPVGSGVAMPWSKVTRINLTKSKPVFRVVAFF